MTASTHEEPTGLEEDPCPRTSPFSTFLARNTSRTEGWREARKRWGLVVNLFLMGLLCVIWGIPGQAYPRDRAPGWGGAGSQVTRTCVTGMAGLLCILHPLSDPVSLAVSQE